MDVSWIFFDVGSTLVDEIEAHDHRAREMIPETDIMFSAFDSERIEIAKGRGDKSACFMLKWIIKRNVTGACQRENCGLQDSCASGDSRQ